MTTTQQVARQSPLAPTGSRRLRSHAAAALAMWSLLLGPIAARAEPGPPAGDPAPPTAADELPPAAAPTPDAPAPAEAAPQDPPPAMAPAPSVPGGVLWAPWDGTTMGWQVLGGVGGLAGGALAGGLLGFVSFAGEANGWDAVGGLAVGILFGAPIGLGVGVGLTGAMNGGNGGWGWATIGGVAGMAIVGGVGISLGEEAGASMALFGALGGAIAGYHLSASPVMARAAARGAPLLRLAPPTPAPLWGSDGRRSGWQVHLLQGAF